MAQDGGRQRACLPGNRFDIAAALPVDADAIAQRVALKGGVAPAAACTTANKGERQIVKYQADYIFWKAV